MELHVDDFKFKTKPTGQQVQGIKSRFTQPASIKDVSARNLADFLTSGQTVQPGITPFSEASRASGAKGTKDSDFNRQIIFMIDIDNEMNVIPVETPAHAADLLAHYNLKPAFMYESFSSTTAQQRFRIVLVADEFFTDRPERDAVQRALIAAFPQSDRTCVNADRIFFGTDKGLIDGYTDFDAVCKKENLLAFAAAYKDAAQALVKKKSTVKQKFGETIPTGQRHGTLVSFATSVLAKYGVCDEAHEAFMQRVAQCETPKPDDEIEKIWRDACNFYQTKVSVEPGYIPPAEYAAQNSAESLIPSDFTDVGQAVVRTEKEKARGTFVKKRADEDKRDLPYPYFIRTNRRGQYIVVPQLANYVRENIQYILVRDSGKQGLLKYVYRDGVYQLYDDDMFLGLIKEIVSEFDEELVRISKLREVLQLINTDLNFVGQDELDADESIINFQNGLLRVTATEATLMPHSPDVLSTIQIPCVWNENPPPTPVFEDFLNTLTDGDADVQELLLEFIGACISNVHGWRMKKSLFLVGNGDTGKSQLKSLTERLLGKGNFIGIDLAEIESRFGTGAIYGTRLAGSSDMSFLTIDELKTFKKITGGDSLFAEFKGKQAFEFTYNGLLWFCMNRLPHFGGDDGQWVYDRILVVNCPNVIPRDKQDKQLLDKMYAEREGIISKCVKAFQQVIANGYNFSEPRSVTTAREQYASENNTVISFFDDCMCEWPSGKIDGVCTTGKVYRVYKAWCGEYNNGFAKTRKEFQNGLAVYLGVSSYSCLTVRREGNTFFRDYCLTSEAKEHFDFAY